MGGRFNFGAVALVAVMAVSGCATPAPQGALIADPYEPINRDIHQFNIGVDQVVVRPVSQVYDIATPELVKHLLRNAANHLRLPGIFVNYALQGDFDGASETFGRFATNTILGGGGLLDPATDFGLPLEPTDFGVTLAEWGVEEGPFVMLPLFGPSTGRDVIGSAVDLIVLNPLAYYAPGSGSGELAFQAGATAAPVIDQRAAQTELLDDLLYEAEDSYVTTRAFYIQNRRQTIAGDEVDIEALPDIFGEE